jgi:hypothetical protein
MSLLALSAKYNTENLRKKKETNDLRYPCEMKKTQDAIRKKYMSGMTGAKGRSKKE